MTIQRRMRILERFVKIVSPRSFNDGLTKCNELGQKLILKRKINRFLDLGCMDGKLTMGFANVAHPQEIYGIEIVDEFRQQAKEKGIKCAGCDLNERWPFESDSFDLILSSQNIEHLYNTRLCLEECYRCLRRGGQLIVLTENLASWANIGALVFGWQPFSTTCINGWHLGNPLIWHVGEEEDQGFLEKHKDIGGGGVLDHIRVLSFEGLKDALRKTGFREIKMFTRGYPPFWGKLAGFLCSVDRRHGHFLIASVVK